jgi:hypothetical protein
MWLHSYQAAVINGEKVVFPKTALASEAALNPRQTIFINLAHTMGAAAGKEPLVNLHRAAVDVIAFSEELWGYSDEPDSVADPQGAPQL